MLAAIFAPALPGSFSASAKAAALRPALWIAAACVLGRACPWLQTQAVAAGWAASLG